MLRRFRFPWRSARHIRRDVDEELAFHLALRAEELERRGLSPAHARAEARREFGDLDATRRLLAAAGRRGERARRARTMIEAGAHDVGYALRSLRRSPGFSLTATIILAFGIGSSVVVFSLLDTLVLRPVPLRAADRLVQIGTRPPADAQWTMQTVRLSVVRQWQADARSFEQFAAFEPRAVTWQGPAGLERITGAGVIGDLFSVLGAPMTAGRAFTGAELEANPAVLSHAFWRRQLGARADVVGQTIELDGATHTIVGVLPPETELPFLGAEQRLVWIPQSPTGDASDRVFVQVVARLRARVEPDAALPELAAIQRRVEDERGLSPKAEGVVLQTAQEDRAELVGPTLFALFGGSLVLLIIACANVGTLSLARLFERRRELAVRCSLGASRWHLWRQIVAEHVVLWAAGGGIGFVLGAAGLRWILSTEPLAGDALLAADTISIDGRIALFACALTLATALAFGWLSALQSSDSSPVAALREGGTTVSPPRRSRRWRQSLVVVQVALSTVLAAGACLLALSLINLTSQPLGFRAADLLTFRVQLPARDYPNAVSRSHLQRELMAALRALPGVEAAATTSALPLGTIVVGPIGIEAAEPRSEPWAGVQGVDRDYFRAAGIAVIEGRVFDAGDTADGEPVAVVNALFARRYFPGQDVVGKRLALSAAGDSPRWSRIIGVVTDVKHAGLDWEHLPEIFIVYEQIPEGPLGGVLGADLFALLRVPDALAPTEALLRRTVAAIDPNLPLMEIQTGERLVAASARRAQFRAALMCGVAALAVLLSGMGLGAVVAQSVAQRRKEFGIRMALGATRAGLLESVCRFGITLAAIGIAIGVLAAVVLAALLQSLQSLLFGVDVVEPVVLAGVALVMLVVAAAAAAVPGWRATTLDAAAVIRR